MKLSRSKCFASIQAKYSIHFSKTKESTVDKLLECLIDTKRIRIEKIKILKFLYNFQGKNQKYTYIFR